MEKLENRIIELKRKLNKLEIKKKKLEDIIEQQINEKNNNPFKQMLINDKSKKNQIIKDKKENPKKYILTSEALKKESKEQDLFVLGLLSKNLENLGIETAIEKNENPKQQNTDFSWFQYLINRMYNKKKYILDFELGEQRNKELLNNKIEYEKFEEKLKSKLSKDFKIPKEKIIVDATLPQKGRFRVQVIFQSEEFNNLNIKQFLGKFKSDSDFEELKNLKEIHEDVIMGIIKLSKNQLDPKGNRSDGWGIGEKRGGKDYDPPIGWKGIGLNVKGKYDNGNDEWIGMTNSPGEWCVAYHGVGRGQSSYNVKDVTGKIIKSKEFRPGAGQVHKNCPDENHPGKIVGEGVYCTPHIKTAEYYSGISDIYGKSYKTVLMVRVKPDALRHCNKCLDSRTNNYLVVNGTNDELRPYRILYKKCKEI